jgi:hypothetical protein
MHAAEDKKSASAARKLRLARRDFPLKEIVLTILMILCLWVVDVFVVQRAYDRNYFRVVGTARQTLKHCRDMVVNRVRPGMYRVQTCHKAYYYKVTDDRVTLVKVKSVRRRAWAN